MSAWASVDRTRGPKTVWFADKPGFFDTRLWLGDRTGPQTKLDLPDDCAMATHRDWLVVQCRSVWTLGGRTHAPDTLLGLPLSRFLAGQREAAVLFEPGDRRALQSFFWADGRLILAILDELQPVFEVLSPREGAWRRERLQGLPAIGVIHVGRLDVEDAESTGDLMAHMQDPLTPPSLALIERGKGPQILKQSSPTFDPSDLVVTSHQAIRVDGERIPYTQIGSRRETGDAPVHMTGYGGFGIPSQPSYPDNSTLLDIP
jgi:prolyl oligopeptidase